MNSLCLLVASVSPVEQPINCSDYDELGDRNDSNGRDGGMPRRKPLNPLSKSRVPFVRQVKEPIESVCMSAPRCG